MISIVKYQRSQQRELNQLIDTTCEIIHLDQIKSDSIGWELKIQGLNYCSFTSLEENRESDVHLTVRFSLDRQLLLSLSFYQKSSIEKAFLNDTPC